MLAVWVDIGIERGGGNLMASEKQPTNEQIVRQLEAIARQLGGIREGQKQIANTVKVIAKSSH